MGRCGQTVLPTMSEIQQILDGVKLVKAYEFGACETVMVWHGGTTTNVYSVCDGTWEETTCFNVSDANGKPVSREEIEDHMEEFAEKYGIA